MKLLVITVLIISLFAGVFYLQGGAENPAVASPGDGPDGRPALAPTVVVAPVGHAEIIDTIESIGTTGAKESIIVASKVTDTVNRVHFDDGDYVEAGEILVEMTNREESALLAEAVSNLDDARRQLIRQQDLDSRGMAAKSVLDEALARVEAAGARMEAITARMHDRLIRAPFSGLLGFRQISPGTLLSPNTPITTLDDISIIKLDFSVPEVQLGAIRPGQRIQAGSDAWPGTVFEGTIDSIGSRVDPVTRAVTVRALITNEERLLRPGMLMSVRIITASRQALVIPESAFIQSGDQTFVYIAGADARAEQRTIKIGSRRRGYVEVVDGLRGGEAVIIEGGFKLKQGMPYRVKDATEIPAARLQRDNIRLRSGLITDVAV